MTEHPSLFIINIQSITRYAATAHDERERGRDREKKNSITPVTMRLKTNRIGLARADFAVATRFFFRRQMVSKSRMCLKLVIKFVDGRRGITLTFEEVP